MEMRTAIEGPVYLYTVVVVPVTTEKYHFSPHIVPVSKIMALDRCGLTPGWTEGHSHSYG